ncbi:MAG TPA: hypothetical protein VFN61_04680 [Acidimicrobiales bacterium]|nr:hypothetical protein [Acidimicrobiales bacterium]
MAGSDSRARGGLGGLGRALFAVGLAALAAVIVRLRGTGGTPPHHGGWRLLTAEDLRSDAEGAPGPGGTQAAGPAPE